MILAIIPARGDSKSIKNKNIVPLEGKPLIAYSIQTALSCKNIDKVIVSTDSQKIAEIARHYGAEIPFLRPKALATDTSPVILTLQHAISWFEQKNKKIDVVVVLQPTNPFRRVEDINQSLKLLDKPKTDSVVSVCQAEHNPYFVMAKIKNNYLDYPLIKTRTKIYNRQQAPIIYRINGCLYTVKKEIIMKKNALITARTRPLVMPAIFSIDIDVPQDLLFCKFLFNSHFSQ